MNKSRIKIFYRGHPWDGFGEYITICIKKTISKTIEECIKLGFYVWIGSAKDEEVWMYKPAKEINE